MKKRFTSIVLAAILAAGTLNACGGSNTASTTAAATEATTAAATEATTEAATTAAATEAATTEAETTEAATEAAKEVESLDFENMSTDELKAYAAAIPFDDTEVRVGSLKGPTTIGLLHLEEDAANDSSLGKFTFDMQTQPDAIVSAIAGGNLDIALVPANLASVLYNKTKGGISVIDINTLGVIYCLSADDSVKSVKDLSGKTVITTGQGATPEYALNYLLEKNGVTDCNVTFASESTEVVSKMAEDSSIIAMLPQPFATVAAKKNPAYHEAFSYTDAWNEVTTDGSQFLTGVTIVRNDFLKEHEADVAHFVALQAASAKMAIEDADSTAELAAKYGIAEKKEAILPAIPKCGMTCLTDETMKTALSGYLQTLFDANPKAIGGTLPGDDFYYSVSDFKG